MENGITNRHRIKLENLEIGYRNAMKREALVFGPVNAEITHAEMVGIIGRNGIGKSTLLRTIAGLQPQLNGHVLIDGCESSGIPLKDMAKLVSYVSTERVGLQNMRVHEMVAMGRFPYTGWIGRMSDSDKDIVRISAEHTGISHLMKKSMSELSDGERQKVMITRALAQDTPVMILDEPTAFLDLPSRYDILRILNDLSLHYRKTILFTTHDLAIALDIADKLWVMAEGRMYEGAPEDLLINKVFRKLFLNSPVEFDARTSSFRFRREMKSEAAIHGEKKYWLLTKKAMERLGFEIRDSSSTTINIIINEQGHPVWICRNKEKEILVDSIYALTIFLRSMH